jgi:lipopolysaccharide heptosyltransferase I
VDRVLLIRLGALGDVVHAIPVAAALRRAFPSARIDWLVSAKHRELLDLVTVVNRRLAINDRSEAAGGMPLVRMIGELRRGRYDVAIDLQGLLKSAVLARSTGAPRVLGFSSRYLREPLARPFYTEVHDPGGAGMYDRAENHVARVNLGLLELLALKVSALEFPIEEANSAVARELRARAGGRYVLLNPGAAWPNKRWPADRLGAVAGELYARHRLRSIVLWGPGEERLAIDVVARSGGAAWSSPPTSIADLVALLRGASLMVSGDTGPAHIAAAVGTPLVGIYGPTRPSRNGPWSAEDVTVSRDAVCQCHHLRRCRIERMCLLDIQVEEVLGAIERRLAVEPTRA